ncbi:putative Intraflagellar Transport Complex [Paratrimastix pyriformis]|uniref:Intraflagellar Transport Complex n=1 Tax=Paratrimastix pyriformis TaxID=342808 RepID=A0ABQ8UUN1_9EUKA|nr:putative Intraflagellar Transport Complex [Paratrimastix pyriformis]
MTDFALESEGASILTASSYDDKHPPEQMLDGDEKTFWMSTGLYPQQFIIAFRAPVAISRIQTTTTNVCGMVIEKAATPDFTGPAQVIFEGELADRQGALQTESQQIPSGGPDARSIRVTIHSGHGDFCSVHKVSVFA